MRANTALSAEILSINTQPNGFPARTWRLSVTTPASPRIRRRVENLSDLVFGLALSLGSIVLVSRLPQTPTDLISGIVLFGLSFLVVVWIWSGYTSVMVLLPFETGGAYLLNIALLFCVAIEPYLFYVLQQSQLSLLGFASSVLALDIGGMMFVLAGLIRLLLGEERKRKVHNLEPNRLERLRRVMISEAATGLIFVASSIPVFWIAVPIGNFLRFDVWYVTLAAFFGATTLLGRRGEARSRYTLDDGAFPQESD